MQKRIEHHDGLDERFPGGIFSSNNGEYVWIAALPPGGLFVEHAGESLYNAANELIKDDPPARYHPQMTARGRRGRSPPASPTARRSIDDIIMVTTICLVIVVALDRALLPAAARHPADRHPGRHRRGHRLRRRRAGVRLPELVDGVPGVDHRRQRDQLRDRPDVALRGAPRARATIPTRRSRAALAGVWRGTLVASISASAAYASLMVTSFRGFYQFGVMGAVGSLACWLATFTVLPALLVLLDRAPGRGSAPGPPAPRVLRRWRASWRGAAATVTAVFTVLAIVGAVGLRHFLQDPFEYDFRKLTAKLKTHRGGASSSTTASTSCSGAGRRRRSCSPTRVDEVEPIKRRIRKQDHGASRAGRRSARWSRSTICCPGRPRCSSASWR